MKRILRSLRPVSYRAVRYSFVLAAALVLLLVATAGVHAQSGGTFELTWFTVDGGGAMALSGGTFELGGSAGQPDAAAPSGGTFELQGGFWNPTSAGPLSVTLASFSATTDGGQVQLAWETVSDLDNAGFNLYRATSPAGPDTLLVFVPSQAPGSSQGFSYSFTDADVEPGLTTWYWLEDVSLAGAMTMHGPLTVTVLAPTAVRIDGFSARAGDVQALLGWPPDAAGLALAAGLLAGAARLRRRLTS